VDFSRFATKRGGDLDVLTGALLIARDAYPDLDFGHAVARLDMLAWDIGSLSGADVRTQAKELGHHLYERHGFRGNSDDYYDPRNSFINEVLERRLGIPISLALVYTEVARRVGVRARGINFPGHFLVRIDGDPGQKTCIIDPFNQGRIMSKQALIRMLHRADRDMSFDESLLAPAGTRDVLVRFLTNLRAIYTSAHDLGRLMVVLSRLTELSPNSAIYVRDRGLAAAKLGAARAAISDFQRYLELSPNAEEAPEVRQLIDRLMEQRGALN
jgi:regulator of sirC expression with transglutaminase-like and TPR domain